MNTPEERPNPERVGPRLYINVPPRHEARARARAAREQMAAALDEDQEPDPDEPLGWQPIWKRP